MTTDERRLADKIHAAVVLAIHCALLPPGMSLPHCIEVRRLMKTAVAEAMRTIDTAPPTPA